MRVAVPAGEGAPSGGEGPCGEPVVVVHTGDMSVESLDVRAPEAAWSRVNISSGDIVVNGLSGGGVRVEGAGCTHVDIRTGEVGVVSERVLNARSGDIRITFGTDARITGCISTGNVVVMK